MQPLGAVDLDAVRATIEGSSRPIAVLWQTVDSVAFVARGRPHRSEFHVDPSDEVMYMVKGDMRLHYLTSDGAEEVALIREGELIHCPAGTPHSPRFPPDAYVLVLERKRRPDEIDRFLWYCPNCRATLFETTAHVADYGDDHVSRAYAAFYGSTDHRTCRQCGHVTPVPG
jgi:3-hydroxyanthranilate 3,4-dioxygenase